MKRKNTVRTGIDFGTTSVKVMRAEGAEHVDRITHIGYKAWEGPDVSVEIAANALQAVLDELGLKKNQLGRIITCVGSKDTAVREVMLPAMSDEEFRQSLPFEARKLLSSDKAKELVSDGQVIEHREGIKEGSAGNTLVLMAAADKVHRDFPVDALNNLGLEPEVVDVEPLALIRALSSSADHTEENDPAHAIIDLGGHEVNIVISYRGAGLLSRTIWESDKPMDGKTEDEWILDIATRTLETLTFYRGRYRREVDTIHLVGGGSLVEGRQELLSRFLNRNVVVGRPLTHFGKDAKGYAENIDRESVFVTASGLIRWGDE